MSNMGVSVIIPAYNSSSTIVRALDSVVNQSQSPLEIIVVNDASKDDTTQIVVDYSRTSSIPLYLHDFASNQGPGAARNFGWDNAKGQYVAFLDADDVWHPRKVELQSRLMDANPNLAMSCHSHHFGVDDPWEDNVERAKQVSHQLTDFLWSNRCATPTVMFRRAVPQRFDPKRVVIGVEDYQLWMRVVAIHGPCRKILAPLSHCSNPAFGGSGLSGRMWAMERGELAVFRALHSERLIGRSRLLVASTWSLLKFVIRLIDRRFIPIRSRRR
jgi:glycosyltransferase involved in cell wall biosynthesis